jgi:putative CocE/NonD family hydrolase
VPAVRESGYLTVRDGVELAFEVVRPAGDGPFPTLFTYDGYAAGSDPDAGYAARYVPRGYALVGLNLRGTGCSGGVFDFFQPAEGRDGYEMVEWIARQPWSDGAVAMIGKSYPGITQFFVAQHRPPHLTALTPGHFFGDAYRDIAFPGGIFNYAFASLWSFVAQPAPGYAASGSSVAGGDATCARHQRHHADNLRTNPFLQAQEHPYDDPLIAERSPLPDLDRIQVPVYTALSWQDEQLMSRQTHVLTELERLAIPYRAVLSNGDHGMYREAPQLAELDRFLEAHLERRPVLRDGTPRARYLTEPPVSVFWEQGEEGEPRWRTMVEEWGAQATPRRLYLGADGTLAPDAPPDAAAADTYAHSAAGSQGIASDQIWASYAPPEGAALAYTSAPFDADTALLGPASADLWLTATAPNVDLQVTLTEIRPDGQEVFVQQGWLRTQQRALDEDASSDLLPVQTHRVADVAALSATEPSLARVEVFAFGHVVRAESRLRVWVEAPTVLPQLEGFALDPTPAAVTVWRDAAHPSSLVLPVADVAVPASARDLAACGSVLRQPCRPDPRP